MSNRISLFGFQIDALRMSEAVGRIMSWTSGGAPRCRYVVTPNVDHTVLLQHHEGLREAYREADLVLADGHPVVWASRLVGRPIPERVPGSDLVPHLFQAADPSKPIRVFLLGAAPGVAERAATNIHVRWPGVLVVGTYSPPLGFENSDDEISNILKLISAAAPDVLVIGLGAPKQELWAHRYCDQIEAKVALCVGATIDFLAGEKQRAPVWMRRTGLEWLHRMLSEPKRLVSRYARDAWIFPQIVWREWTARRAI